MLSWEVKFGVTWWLGILMMLPCSLAVLMNPFTRRCIHAGYRGTTHSIQPYTQVCTFHNAQENRRSHPHQWVEIVRAGNPGEYQIQIKLTGSMIGCLAVEEVKSDFPLLDLPPNAPRRLRLKNTPDQLAQNIKARGQEQIFFPEEEQKFQMLANLRRQATSPTNNHKFRLKVVRCGRNDNNRLNFKFIPVKSISNVFENSDNNFETSPVYLIESVGMRGRCVGASFGRSDLVLAPCSKHSRLQQFVRCRHVEKCDAELEWSHRKIIFPGQAETSRQSLNSSATTDAFVATSTGGSGSKLNGDEVGVTLADSGVVQDSNWTTPKVTINEVLYYAWNSLLEGYSENKISEVLTDFYEHSELQTALEILKSSEKAEKAEVHKETYYYYDDDDEDSSSSKKMTALALLQELQKIKTSGKKGRWKFLSEHKSGLPSWLSMGKQQEDTLDTLKKKFAQLEETLEELQGKIRLILNAYFDKIENDMGDLKTSINGKEQSLESQEDEPPKDIIELIDIRSKLPRRKKTK